jgi:hypothetical protein
LDDNTCLDYSDMCAAYDEDLRRQLAAARRMAGEQWQRAIAAEKGEREAREAATLIHYNWRYYREKIDKALEGCRRIDEHGDNFYGAHMEILRLRDRHDSLLRWQHEALPVLRFLVGLVEQKGIEIPESIRRLLHKAEEMARRPVATE